MKKLKIRALRILKLVLGSLSLLYVTNHRRVDISICKYVPSIGHSHDGRALLGIDWYSTIPFHPRDGNCVNVIYVTAVRTAVARESTISCREDKDGSFATATLYYIILSIR